ncbi:MAG: CoA-binding protein [Balneolales bacterium]|nr:CoA-binding protein [Balneolales bacterium]
MKKTFNTWYDKKMYATPELAEETNRVEQLLQNVKTVAIVGISKNPQKDSHFVGRYLQKHGIRIVPVNPGAPEILGEKTYADLQSIPFPVDVVDIFRRPEDIPSTVQQALAIKAPLIWLQLGTGTHDELKQNVLEQGAELIQNRCIKVDHQFLIRDKQQ